MADSQLGIVVKTYDESTATLKKIDSSVKRLETSGKRAADSLSRMDKIMGNMRGRIRAAFEFHVVNRGLMLMEQGLRKVANAIPDLISRGEKWAAVVDEIADVTGLAAEKASELAAIQGYLNDGTDSLGRALMVLSKNAVTNRKAFDQLGIATRDSNGRLLDAYEIIGNVRQRLAATGTGLLTTTAAQKVFGRGAHDLLDLLTLTNEQWAIYAEQARRSGLILTEAGLEAADQWTRTKRVLEGALTGLGSMVLNNVAPVLVRLVNGITKVIQDNMAAIVEFVAKAVTFVAHLVGGLFGIDLQMQSIVEQVADAADAVGDVSLRQRDFRDQTKKATKDTDAGNAAWKRRQALLRAVTQAERDLARAKAAYSFGGGDSRLEVELARQARIARIREAQERLAEARKALNERRADASEYVRIAATAAKNAGIRWKGVFGKGGEVPASISTGLSDALAQAAKDAAASGSSVADAIKDAIFGEDSTLLTPQGQVMESRSGGLLDKLSGLVTALAGMGTHLDNLNKLLGGNLPALIAGMVGLKVALGVIPGAGAASSAVTGGVGAAIGAIGGAPTIVAIAAALLPALFVAAAGGAYRPDRVAGAPGTNISSDRPQGPPNVHGTPESRARHARWALLQNAARKSMPWLHRDPAEPWIPDSPAEGPQPGPAPGLSLTTTRTTTSKLESLGALTRRYFGDTSPMVTTQRETAEASDWLVSNTLPLAEGSIRAEIGAWADGVQASVTGSVGILATANTVSLGDSSVNVTGSVGILTGQNTVTVGNDTVNVGGNVGLLATKNTVTVGNQTLNVGGNVGILTTDNRVSLGNSFVNVKGDVGLLTSQNTVHVGNQTLSVGGNVGLLSNQNTVNVGNQSLDIRGSVGLIQNSNTIRLGAVDGGVTIQVGGSVALTDALTSYMQATAVNTGNLKVFNDNILYQYLLYLPFIYRSWESLQSIKTNMVAVATWADRMYGYMGRYGLSTVGQGGWSVIIGAGPGGKVPVDGDFQGDITVPRRVTIGDWDAGTLGTNVWNRPDVDVGRPNVDVANKPNIEVGRWDPWASGMYVMQAGIQGYLQNIWHEGNRKDYATFATGTPYVPKTGMALIHQGEIIIPASLASIVRRGGAEVSSRAASVGGSAAQQAINVVVQIGDRTIARALGIVSGATSTIRVQPAI